MKKEKTPILFQYLDKAQLEKIQESFAKAVGIACSILECSTDGKQGLDPQRFVRITRESGCSRFCTMVRSTKEGLHRCRECDLKWAEWMYKKSHGDPGVVFKRYRCHSGLVDMVAPIFIGRDIRGFIFGGQRRRAGKVTSKRINELARLAEEIGVPGNRLTGAYLELPEMTEEQLDNAASLMAEVANQISDLALQAQRFHLVSKSAAAVASSTDPSEVYARILHSAMEVATCERATLWEYEPTKKQLRVLKRVVPDYIPEAKRRELRSVRQLGEGLAGLVAQTRKAQAIENITREKDRRSGVKKFLGGMKSEYAVPVINNDVLVSVLMVKSDRVGKWPKAVTEGLQLLADVAAIAILNARTMQSKQTLLETASHELLGPLHAMKTFADELVKRPKMLTPEELEYYGRMSLNRINLAEAHVRNMLLIAREDRTGLELHDEHMGVGGLIERSLQLVRDLADEKEIRFQIRRRSGLPSLRVDARWMADVALRNLLHNAVKYAPARTSVTISAQIRKGGMSISVEDKGPGVDAEGLKHLGERFYRRGAMGGLGLGLAAVKAIMRVHGGSMTLCSEKGKYFRAAIQIPTERLGRETEKGTECTGPDYRRR